MLQAVLSEPLANMKVTNLSASQDRGPPVPGGLWPPANLESKSERVTMGRSGQHLKWWMPIVGRFAANALLLWTKFVPTRVHIIDPRFNYLNEPFVVSAWHEALLIPALKLRQFKFQVLASLSRDGEWTKQIVEPLGLETIRGSSSRGGAQAVLEILKSKERRKLAVAITLTDLEAHAGF